MKLQYVKSALLALAGMALLSHSAKAQATTNGAANGDLILGVYQTNSSATGYGTIYIADLGSYTNILPSSTNLTFTTQTANLSGVFGSALSQASYFIIGAQSSNGFATYNGTANVGKHAVFTTLVGSAPATTSYNSVGGAFSNIPYGLLTTGTTLSANESTNTGNTGTNPVDGNLGSAVIENSIANSSNYYLLNTDATTAIGTAQTTTQEASTLIGSFSWVGGTTLTFTAQAVPEPSAFALGFCGMFLLWVLKRRRSVV